MKKVAILTSVHNPFDTRIFYRTAASLAKFGYDVTLIAPSNELQRCTIQNIQIEPVKKQKHRLLRITKTTWDVYKKAVQLDADIYHFHDPELIFVGYLLQLRGKVVIYDIHENVAKQILTKNWLPFKKLASMTYKGIERLFIAKFHIILAEQSYEKLYLRLNNKITVQNFPNLDMIPDQVVEKEKNSIVYLGGVSKVRGIETILHALAKMKKDGHPFSFTCIGPIQENYKQYLQHFCVENNIEDNVSFLGRLKADDAYEIVKYAQVGLALLHPIENYLESYPTKVFEYMALRTPYITSNFELYEQLTEDTKAGLTVNPYSEDELVEALTILLQNDSIVTKMSERGRKAVERKYNWKNEEQKLLNLYDSI